MLQFLRNKDNEISCTVQEYDTFFVYLCQINPM